MKTLQCGFAEQIITPHIPGIFQDGYGFRQTPGEGALDDLYVKTAVFACGEERLALAVFDICGFSETVYQFVADQVSILTDIPKDKLVLAATHTHSGPACGLLSSVPVSWDYWAETATLCAQAILEATARLTPCTIATSISPEPLSIGLNRRGRPPIDRRVKTAVFRSLKGELLGVIASASCHPVINTSMNFSADYPSVLTQQASDRFGVPFLFLQGRCGDINPGGQELDISQRIAWAGTELCRCVFSAVDAAGKAVSVDTITCRFRWATLPMAPLDLSALKEGLRQSVHSYRNESDPAKRHVILGGEVGWYRAMIARNSAELSVPIALWFFGDAAAFAFVPFELLTLTGNAIEAMLVEKGYPPQGIFVQGYSNCVNGYLAPKDEIPYGGYEVGGFPGSAPRWIGLPECSPQTEPALLRAFWEVINL